MRFAFSRVYVILQRVPRNFSFSIKLLPRYAQQVTLSLQTFAKSCYSARHDLKSCGHHLLCMEIDTPVENTYFRLGPLTSRMRIYPRFELVHGLAAPGLKFSSDFGVSYAA